MRKLLNYTKDLELKRRDFFLKELTRKADSILLWELNQMR